MDESILREAGHRLYVTSRLKEMKRYLVFRARCRMHKDIMEDFLDFFAETPLRKDIFPYRDQLTAVLFGLYIYVESPQRVLRKVFFHILHVVLDQGGTFFVS